MSDRCRWMLGPDRCDQPEGHDRAHTTRWADGTTRVLFDANTPGAHPPRDQEPA